MLVLALQWALLLLLLPGPVAPAAAAPPLKVGAAIADVTGPAADINFMGYAMMDQVGRGLHFRLRARAFVFQEVRVLFRRRVCSAVCPKLPNLLQFCGTFRRSREPWSPGRNVCDAVVQSSSNRRIATVRKSPALADSSPHSVTNSSLDKTDLCEILFSRILYLTHHPFPPSCDF